VTRVRGDLENLSAELPDEELLRLAPQVFRDLSPPVPIRALLALSQRLGGATVAIPFYAKEKSRLCRIMGAAALEALCRAMRGEQLEVPIAHRLRTFLLWREVVALVARGSSTGTVAVRFGLTRRHIFRILAQARKTDQRKIKE
jgi:hypothetical protein